MVNIADIAGATYLDVAADSFVIKEVKRNTVLPLCVSSISLHDLYVAATEGVDLLEIGNYDFFYQQGLFLSHTHILNLAQEATKLFPGLDICVTIPYTLSLSEQIQLACQLESIGVKILQTESLKIKSKSTYCSLTELIGVAIPVLSSTYAISQAVNVPIIAASGMNCLLASLAMLYGASGVAIGTSLADCSSSLLKFAYLKETMASIQASKVMSPSNTISSIYTSSGLLA